MHHALKRHPDSFGLAETRVEVELACPRANQLVLSYTVTGKMSDVRMPPVTAAARSDNLWQHTCFEAFVRPSPGMAYYEFNFSPSTEWAVYRFDSTRRGMAAAEIGAPQIDLQSGPDRTTLQVALALDG